MRKAKMAGKLARRTGVSRGEAADQLDRVVRDILWNLRRSRAAPWPGLGNFTIGPDGRAHFEHEESRDR